MYELPAIIPNASSARRLIAAEVPNPNGYGGPIMPAKYQWLPQSLGINAPNRYVTPFWDNTGFAVLDLPDGVTGTATYYRLNGTSAVKGETLPFDGRDSKWGKFLDAAIPILAVVALGGAIAVGSAASAGAADVGIGQIGASSMTPQQIEAASVAGSTEAGYSAALEPFGYTSGEATVAASDAQNVSFGFNTSEGLEPVYGAERSAIGEAVGDATPLEFNTTPESLVSDYGTVSDPGFAQTPVDEFGVSGDSIRLSRVGPATSETYGVASGGGVTGPKSLYDGVGAALKTGVQTVKTAASVVGAGKAVSQLFEGGGVKSQVESQQARTYTGQLGTDNALPTARMGWPVWVGVAGVALLVFAVIKGKAAA